MSLKYFVKLLEGAAISLLVTTDRDTIVASGFEEITQTQYEQYRNDIGDVANLKKLCKNELDAFAGDVRLRFITFAPGQAETYILKAQEAKELKALNFTVASMANYPMIAAEMQATALDLTTCCNTILYMENVWKQVAAAVEYQRLLGKINVDAATTSVDVLNAKNTAMTALNLIGQ